MVTSIHKKRKDSEVRSEEFTSRQINGVEVSDIYDTVLSITNPYGLPCVLLNIVKNGDKVDINITPSPEFMHFENLYAPDLFEELVNLPNFTEMKIHMKFNGFFFSTTGPIDGMGEGVCTPID